ncbi:hypothetical protein pb186bvf_016308 [Paramecium bursaria]
MNQGSFIQHNHQLKQLDEFRRDVREKVYSKFESQKNVLAQASQVTSSSSIIHSMLRNSISPKSPRQSHVSDYKQPSPLIGKNTPPRLSFQRSSLDVGRNSQQLTYPKKNLQDVIPVNRIIDLQKTIKSLNYQASESYMNELKKLARIVLKE